MVRTMIDVDVASRGEVAWDLWDEERAAEQATAAKVAARYAATREPSSPATA